jgi:general secretion pathway protein G
MERSTVTGKNKMGRSGEAENMNLTSGASKSQIANRKSQMQAGFSILEMMIAMFILVILLSVALPAYQRTVQHARETVLKENIWQIERAIDQYTTDKGKLPQSIDDLVTEKYLHEKPIDPITEKAEWNEVMGEDKVSPDGAQGLIDVKSLAEGTDSDGKQYSEY